MKPIKEVYKDVLDELGEYWHISDYNPLLKSFGYEILLQIDDKDYSGDSRLLFKNNNKYGVLIFGWGSCSGCDALQGCSNFQEIEDLRDDLLNSIKWFDTSQKCYDYIDKKDWELEYSYYYETTKEFIEKTKAILINE